MPWLSVLVQFGIATVWATLRPFAPLAGTRDEQRALTRQFDSTNSALIGSARPGIRDFLRAIPLPMGGIAVLVPGDSARMIVCDSSLHQVFSRTLPFRSGHLAATSRNISVLDPTSGTSMIMSLLGLPLRIDTVWVPSRGQSTTGRLQIAARLTGGRFLAIDAITSQTFLNDRPDLRVLIIDSLGQATKEIARTSPENRAAQFQVGDSRSLRTFFGRLERFAGSALVRASPAGDRIVIVNRPILDSTRAIANVSILSVSGDPILAKRLQFSPVEVSRRVADSIIAFHAEGLQPLFHSIELAAAELRKTLRLGPRYPAVLDLVAAADGRIWLELPTGDMTAAHWQVLDFRGNVVYEVDLARGHQMIAAAGNRFWTLSVTNGQVALTLWRARS